jgi:hypothetical protein
MTTNITPTARDAIRELVNNSGDNVIVVEKKMMEVTRTKMKFTYKSIALLKMKKLTQLRIGTTRVESIAKQIENLGNERCEETVMFIMKRQTRMLEETVKKMKKDVEKVTNETMKMLRMEWRRKKMKEIMNEEIERLWMKLKGKMMETIRFLKGKYGKKNEIRDQNVCNGVKICDDWIGNEEELEKADEKVVKEDVETNEDENAFLRVPNKMSDNTEFNKTKTMTDIQIMLCKIRMSVRKRDEDIKSEMTEEELENVKTLEREARKIVIMDEMTIDFAKRKVTDMKTCRRMTLPKCLDGETEAKLKTLEGCLEGAVLKEEKRIETRKKERDCPDRERSKRKY